MSNYTNNHGQVGLMGPNGRVENNTFQFQQNQNPALDELGGLLERLLADLQAADKLDPGKREDAVYEVQTAADALGDLREGNERGKSRLMRFLTAIKNNAGPVADSITILKEASGAAITYGPGWVAVVEAALHALGG